MCRDWRRTRGGSPLVTITMATVYWIKKLLCFLKAAKTTKGARASFTEKQILTYHTDIGNCRRLLFETCQLRWLSCKQEGGVRTAKLYLWFFFSFLFWESIATDRLGKPQTCFTINNYIHHSTYCIQYNRRSIASEKGVLNDRIEVLPDQTNGSVNSARFNQNDTIFCKKQPTMWHGGFTLQGPKCGVFRKWYLGSQ